LACDSSEDLHGNPLGLITDRGKHTAGLAAWNEGAFRVWIQQINRL